MDHEISGSQPTPAIGPPCQPGSGNDAARAITAADVRHGDDVHVPIATLPAAQTQELQSAVRFSGSQRSEVYARTGGAYDPGPATLAPQSQVDQFEQCSTRPAGRPEISRFHGPRDAFGASATVAARVPTSPEP